MRFKQILRFLASPDHSLKRSSGAVSQNQGPFGGLRERYIGHLDTSEWASGPWNTVNVIDISVSMRKKDCKPSRLEAAKLAAQQFITRRAESSPQDRIALVSFATHAKVVLSLTNICDAATILKCLKDLKIDGGTDINEGLKAAGKILLEDWSQDVRESRLKRILLLTDGNGGHPIRTAENIKSHGVLIDVVGVGQPEAVNHELLRKIATTDSDGTHFRFFRDTDSLIAHYDDLATGIMYRGHDK